MSRFGDTAANAFALTMTESFETSRNWPTPVKTIFASLSASCFRIGFMPVDTIKTIMQVEGKNGIPTLLNKVKVNGIFVFW